MNRRKFLLGILASGIVVGTSGVIWLKSGSNYKALTIDASLETLDRLMNQKVTTLGAWNIGQIFIHSAQSIEFSISGFPEHKPALFKNTIGSLAFSAFSVKGQMIHNLSEAIPGAKLLKENEDINYAYERLKKSMLEFKNYDGQLAEHFAYGSLTKEQYEKAHSMHFYNHLLEVEQTS